MLEEPNVFDRTQLYYYVELPKSWGVPHPKFWGIQTPTTPTVSAPMVSINYCCQNSLCIVKVRQLYAGIKQLSDLCL